MNMGTWTAIGAGIGAALGVAMNNVGVGLPVGIAIGLAIGAAQSWTGRKRREPKGEPPIRERDR
jgi:hypothetical protein